MKNRKQKLIIVMLMIAAIALSQHHLLEIAFADNQEIATSTHSVEESVIKMTSVQSINDVAPESDFEFNNGTITKYTGNQKNIKIPETISGQTVTSIGDRAFLSNVELLSVEIPNTVTSIGEETFQQCRSMTSIILPDSLESIGGWAFEKCWELKSITFPNKLREIGGTAFSECKKLESIIIPDSVTSIGNAAFSKCDQLKSITLSESITNIKNWVFADCTALTTITIPNKVTSIDFQAFKGCTALKEVAIPNKVTSIGEEAFKGCIALKEVVIPNTLESIASNAFEGCSVDKLIVTCQDKENIDISVGSPLENITSVSQNVYRISTNRSHHTEIKYYDLTEKPIPLQDIFKIEGVIYTGNTGTEKYNGQDVDAGDYFDLTVSYAIVGATSNDTLIQGNQLYIGRDEQSDNLKVKVNTADGEEEISIKIIPATEISIKNEPQNIYKVEDNYNPEGLEITVKYQDGYQEDIQYNETNQNDFTFQYHHLDITSTKQMITYKGLTVEQKLTIYDSQTLKNNESKIEIYGEFTDGSYLDIGKIKDTDREIYTNLNDKNIIGEFDIQVIGQYHGGLDLCFHIGNEYNGKKVYIRHLKHDRSIEEFEETVSEGQVKITVNELSPFVIYTDKEKNETNIDNNIPNIIPQIPDNTNNNNTQIKKHPQKVTTPTGDNQNILLWGVMGVISVTAAIMSVKKKKSLYK